MSLRKISTSLVLLFTLTILHGHAQEFKLIKATSTNWSGGVKGSGNGTNYEFFLKANCSSSKINFTGLWVGDRTLSPVYVVIHHPLRMGDDQEKKFDVGDTILFKFTLMQTGEQVPDDRKRPIKAEESEVLQVPPPKPYEGLALIAYTYKKKKRSVVIKEAEKLPAVSRP